MKLRLTILSFFLLIMGSTNAQSAPKIQFFTLESGCKMEIYKNRSGEEPLQIKRTERANVLTEIDEGVYDVTITCTAPTMLLVQVKVGEVNKPLLDKQKLKVWNTFLVAKAGEQYVYTPCWFKE
jgi:hypothetical protein